MATSVRQCFECLGMTCPRHSPCVHPVGVRRVDARVDQLLCCYPINRCQCGAVLHSSMGRSALASGNNTKGREEEDRIYKGWGKGAHEKQPLMKNLCQNPQAAAIPPAHIVSLWCGQTQCILKYVLAVEGPYPPDMRCNWKHTGGVLMRFNCAPRWFEGRLVM